MKKISAMVVDDEPLARSRLRRLLSDFADVEVIAEADDGALAVQRAISEQPDIIFMDIQMPRMTGLQASKQIVEYFSEQDQGGLPSIIFCTAYEEHALQAFRINAQDYLLKPISEADLRAAILRATKLSKLQISSLPEASNRATAQISIRNGSVSELVGVDQIYYFRSENKYVLAGLSDNKETVVNQTLKQLEKRFESHFLRVHRNALVNRSRIKRLSINSKSADILELHECETHFSVSRRALAEVKHCFD